MWIQCQIQIQILNFPNWCVLTDLIDDVAETTLATHSPVSCPPSSTTTNVIVSVDLLHSPVCHCGFTNCTPPSILFSACASTLFIACTYVHVLPLYPLWPPLVCHVVRDDEVVITAWTGTWTKVLVRWLRRRTVSYVCMFCRRRSSSPRKTGMRAVSFALIVKCTFVCWRRGIVFQQLATSFSTGEKTDLQTRNFCVVVASCCFVYVIVCLAIHCVSSYTLCV